jgi:multimeric flavodoxin WrbA
MKIIAFLGSPRKGGNTETLLKEAIRGAGEDVRLFDLNRMNIRPCRHCGGCEETGRCVLVDDMAEVADAIRAADRIILASPVFFSGISAQAKTMIDRCQQFWCEKYLLKRPIPEGPHGRKGLLIVVGGQKNDAGIKCCEATADAFFKSVSVGEHRTIGFTGIDAKGAVRDHPTALREAFEAGRWLGT